MEGFFDFASVDHSCQRTRSYNDSLIGSLSKRHDLFELIPLKVSFTIGAFLLLFEICKVELLSVNIILFSHQHPFSAITVSCHSNFVVLVILVFCQVFLHNLLSLNLVIVNTFYLIHLITIDLFCFVR